MKRSTLQNLARQLVQWARLRQDKPTRKKLLVLALKVANSWQAETSSGSQ